MTRIKQLLGAGPRLVAVVAVVVLMLVGGIVVLMQGPDTRTVTAHFDRAVSLFPDSEVRILGVPVGGTEPVGRGRDPKGIFRVVTEDGEPAIRISGEMLGGLATTRDYSDKAPGKPTYDSIDIGEYLQDKAQGRRRLFLLHIRAVGQERDVRDSERRGGAQSGCHAADRGWQGRESAR